MESNTISGIHHALICPEGCGQQVDVTIHEATGKKIIWVKGNPHVLHECSLPKKYWCYGCDAAIPYSNPCIHRRLKLNPERPKDRLDFY